eukprot:5376269-Pleurochrysis_carterae.AAC.1
MGAYRRPWSSQAKGKATRAESLVRERSNVPRPATPPMLMANVCRPQLPRHEDQITWARSRRRGEVEARTLRARCRTGSGNVGIR